MIINPITAIKNRWITYPGLESIEDWEQRKFISPNAIDFPLDVVYAINGQDTFVISEQGKQMRSRYELHPIPHRRTNIDFWILPGHNMFDGMSHMYVTVPPRVGCFLIARSTFSRNGVFLTSGWYDSGYEGQIGFAIHNRLAGSAKIATGTRIGQIIFFEVDCDRDMVYAGGYSHSEGTFWTEGQRHDNCGC